MPLDILHTQHERRFAESKFVYPVLSRRSGGISLGVNLNPDKVCNFDCIYCQVDRTTTSDTLFVELPQLLNELDYFLDLVTSGELYETEKFSHTPPQLRRLNDIAFSGDGEPTTHRNFDEVIAAVAALKQKHNLPQVKLLRGLELLDQNNGEIWAKLEAGTAEYFKKIDRTTIHFEQILQNITAAAKIRPLVIQSLFMRVAGDPPPAAEIEAFCDRLNEISGAGGQLSLIQIYTVARKPTESYVTPLTDAEVDAIVNRVQARTGLQAAAFYGTNTDALT
jgi:wyosine [tRNA(Phe)-imidazoG37] synthetase (radical SAM superfamily)